MRFTCLDYDARRRASLYATDQGSLVAVSDDALSAHYQMYQPRGLRAEVLAPNKRSYPIPGDDGRVQAMLLPFEIDGWTGYARYLAPWDEDLWVLADLKRIDL